MLIAIAVKKPTVQKLMAVSYNYMKKYERVLLNNFERDDQEAALGTSSLHKQGKNGPINAERAYTDTRTSLCDQPARAS